MIRKKNRPKLEEQLDRLNRGFVARVRLDQAGREVVRAVQLSEREIEEINSTPFSYARLRARIAAERERRATENTWLTMLLTAWRPVTAMALTMVVSAALFWFTLIGQPTTNSYSESALFVGESSFDRIVFTGGNAPLSGDEVLGTIISQDEGDAQR